MVRFACKGHETSILDCDQLTDSDSCTTLDFGIICSDYVQLNARLINGKSQYDGVLEVSQNGTYFSVCSYGFMQVAFVACRTLGLSSTKAVAVRQLIQGSNTEVPYMAISCVGRETSLTQCGHRLVNSADCKTNAPIGLICSNHRERLRLTGTSRTRHDMGRVEIQVADEWYSLCVYSDHLSKVVCRLLNLPWKEAVMLWESPGTIVWQKLRTRLYCDGDEVSILDCYQFPHNMHRSIDSNFFGVFCSSSASLLIHPGETRYPLMEGTNVTLKCGYKHLTLYNVTWSENAGGVTNGSKLMINELNSTHNGSLVKCEAMSKTGSLQSTRLSSDILELQVYYKPSIQITSNITTCNPQTSPVHVCVVTHNTSVTIVCNADSNPPPANISWSGPVSNDTEDLHLSAADYFTHEGLYTCSVFTQSVDGDERLPLSSSYTFTMIIQDRPTVLSFQMNGVDNKSVTVLENSIVNMSCQASGRPNIIIIKELNRQELRRWSQEDIRPIEEKRSDLNYSMLNVECQQSGDYRCEVNNGLGNDSRTVTLLVQCAPKIENHGQLPDVDIRDNKGYLSIKMTSYPVPYVTSMTYRKAAGKHIPDTSLLNNKLHVTCMSKPLTPALVTCNLSVANVTPADKGAYTMVFSNSLGNTSFNFLLRFEAEEEASSTTKPSDTAVIAGAAVAGAAVVGLSASSSLLFWKKRKRQRLLAEQEKHRNEGGSFRPLHEPEEEETYVDIEDVADEPAVGEEYGYSEIDDGTGRGRRHKPPLPQRDAQRTGIEDPYDQAISSSEDVRPGTSRGSKKTTKKVSLNLHGTEIPYGVCKDTEQQQSSSETSSEDSPASSSPSSKGNESESYTYPGSQHGKKEDYLTPAPSSPGAEQTGSRSLATAAVRNADDYLTPTSADSKGRTQVVTAEVTRADDYLTPTSDTGGGAMTVAADGVRRADDYLTPTSNTSTEGRQAVTTPDYYLTPISGDTVEGSLANDYFTPATEKSGEGSTTPGVADDKQAHIYTPLLPQPQFVLSEEMKKAGYLTPVHIPTTPDTQETDSTISDRKKAGYLTPVEVPGSPELGSKSQERSAPSQDIKKPQDYLTPVSSSSSSSVAAPAKKKKEKSSMIPLAEFWSSKRLSSQRKSPPSSEGETEATHTYEKMGNVKYTEPGNDPAYTKIGEVPVTVSTDPDSYQNC